MAFARRTRRLGVRPSRQWQELATTFTASSAVTVAVPLWGLQSPAPGAGLTSLPPEDVVIMRVRGNFSVSLTSGPAAWVLGMTVQDQTWTPANVFRTDADKRWLWTRTYMQFGAGVQLDWFPPGMAFEVSSGLYMAGSPEMTSLDISPKVKVEAGQALYLVLYEETGASTLAVGSIDMRMLWQTKRR